MRHVLLLLALALVWVVQVESGSCLLGSEILKRYPESEVCKPQLNETKLYFYDAKRLDVYVHASTSGISAGIEGQRCKEDGLAFFCSAVFAPCYKHYLAQAPWPGLVFLPVLPCESACLKAKESCKHATVAESIDCEPFEGDALVVPDLNVTIPCNAGAPKGDAYSDADLNCAYPLAYDPRTVSCGLSCPGTDYPEAPRNGLIVSSGVVMLVVALSSFYAMVPTLHKACLEGLFKPLLVSHSPPRTVVSKLMFLFLLNLFLYCFAWIPYVFSQSEDLWCTDGVFGRAHDNGAVAIMGFLQISSNMAYRGYWFLLLVNMWCAVCLGNLLPGGPYFWAFLMTLPFLWGYPTMIYAWATNNIASVPSLHPIAYVAQDRVPNLKLALVDVPLTVVTVASIPFILMIAWKLWSTSRALSKSSASNSRLKLAKPKNRTRHLRMLAWYCVYEIPALITIGFFWEIYGTEDAIGQGYADQIRCSIANPDTSLCKNDALFSVPWLVFVGLFPLSALIPVGFIVAGGKNNFIPAWWRHVLTKFSLPPALLVLKGPSSTSSSSSHEVKPTSSSLTPPSSS